MSDPILEAEEIAALMQAVVPEEKAIALFASLPPVEQPKKVDSFEFNGNADVGPETFPMFGNMHERVAEMVTERWSHTLRRDVPVFFKDLLKRSYLDILDTDTPRVYFTVDSPGLDSMLSSSPASSALCASAPFFMARMVSLSPCLAAKARWPTIHMKPASPLGSITPCFQGLSAWADAGAARLAASRNAAQAGAANRIESMRSSTPPWPGIR